MEIQVEIAKIFEEAFQADVIGQVFSSYLKPVKNDHANHLKASVTKFQSIFSAQPTEQQSALITALIKYIHSQQVSRRVTFAFEFLEACIKDGYLPLKPVLDSLQSNDLVYNNKLHWCKTYEIIRKYIHRIDYKGCRNLLHAMIAKMREIPTSAWDVAKQQVDAICQSIDHVIDPESFLLPGYLAINEIRQNLTDEQVVAPWPLYGKLIAFVDRFRATAAMVTTTGRWALLPVVDHAFHQQTNTWKLEPDTLRFSLKRQLPYCKEMYQRQWKLLRYILSETHSRDMVLQVLGLQKNKNQRCVALETELVELMIASMQDCDVLLVAHAGGEEPESKHGSRLFWQHLSSQVIYVVLSQLASFPLMVEQLHTKLLANQKKGDDIRRGREYLTWCLLQFISGSIQKNPLSDCLPVIKLISLLYNEREPLPLPDVNKSSCVVCFSAMCILMHLNKKIRSKSQPDSSLDDNEYSKYRHIPVALQQQYEFFKQCLQASDLNLQDYRIALVCNACSTTTDLFNFPNTTIVDSVYGESPGTPMPGTGCVAFNKTVPLQMELLDSLTAHTKLSILHHIGNKVQKLGQTKSPTALSPALIETYSRLLVYTEIEALGIKGLVKQVLPKTCEFKAWGILHALFEMISYRMYHIQPLCRIQLLTTLHSLANSQHADHKQLHLGIENTALKLIMGFDNFDIKPQLVRSFSDQKQFVSQSSEELNRVLVLTLARSIHVTGTETISGSWCVDILKAVMAATPHKWPQQTLDCFPQSVQEYFQQQTVECVNKKELQADVEDEYAKWGPLLTAQEGTSLTEADALNYFKQSSTPPYFMCLVWKVLLEGKTPSVTIYRVLDSVSANQLSVHVRTFSDFLVYEFSGGTSQHLKKRIDVLLDMIWKYNLVFLDRLILCLSLRSSEPDDLQVAFFIIQYLLIKPDDFRNRVRDLVQDVDHADHWLQSDWHSQHMAFHQKFPEKYFFEGFLKHCSGADNITRAGESSNQYLPTYFGNITLRFLAVLDILIHRCLEVSPSSKSLENLLDHLGSLYKFHDRPITYLFNTLHYYEAKLRDRYALKKKLVSTIIGAITENKPPDWSLSQDFVNHVINSNESSWQPDPAYFIALVQRFVDTIRGKKPPPFTSRDWRFNEFPNSSAHALHVTCVEVLALPIPGDQAGLALMDVVLKTQPMPNREEMFSWMNALAPILTALPEIYWKPLHQSILSMMGCETLKSPIEKGSPYPFHILAYSEQRMSFTDLPCTRLLALAHIVWYHMSIGQLSLVSQFLKEEVKPLVETELQLLYVFHLIGPYFPRFRQERTRCMMDVALLLYDILLQVSKRTTEIHFQDEIADFLYHVKYMHIGTALNDKIEEVCVQLQPDMRKRLQFVTQASAPPASTAGRQQMIFMSTATT